MIGDATRVLELVRVTLGAAVYSHQRLVVENLLLGEQLRVALRSRRRPDVRVFSSLRYGCHGAPGSPPYSQHSAHGLPAGIPRCAQSGSQSVSVTWDVCPRRGDNLRQVLAREEVLDQALEEVDLRLLCGAREYAAFEPVASVLVLVDRLSRPHIHRFSRNARRRSDGRCGPDQG